MYYQLYIDGKNFKKIEMDKGILKDYLGGTGIGIKILYDLKAWEKKAISKENNLVMSPGLRTARVYPTASKTIYLAQ